MLVAFNRSVRRNPKADIAIEKDAMSETLQQIRREPRTWSWRKEGSKARRPCQRPDREAVLEPECEIYPRRTRGKEETKIGKQEQTQMTSARHRSEMPGK